MAQSKSTTESDKAPKRDEDGRFAEKDGKATAGAAKPAGNGSKSSGGAKSSGNKGAKSR